jgi:hypothetical protein
MGWLGHLRRFRQRVSFVFRYEALALPIIIYFWKVIVEQGTRVGHYRSDHGHGHRLVGVIVTTYVGGRSIEKVAQIFKR